jgi:hypothetical protein
MPRDREAPRRRRPNNRRCECACATISLDIREILHARVATDRRVPVLRERAADRDIRRLIEVDARSVSPDDGGWLGRIGRRREEDSGAEYVVVRARVDDLLR